MVFIEMYKPEETYVYQVQTSTCSREMNDQTRKDINKAKAFYSSPFKTA